MCVNVILKKDCQLKRNLLMKYGYLFYTNLIFLGISIYITVLYHAQGSIRASKYLHQSILNSCMKCPMYYFDSTPLGRILNRFSGDIENVDNILPQIYQQARMMIFSVFEIFYLKSFFCRWFVSLTFWKRRV